VGHLKFARFRVAKEHKLNWSPHGVFIQDHQPPPIMNFAIIFCCKRRAQCLERGQHLFPSLLNFSITQPKREREREGEREREFLLLLLSTAGSSGNNAEDSVKIPGLHAQKRHSSQVTRNR